MEVARLRGYHLAKQIEPFIISHISRRAKKREFLGYLLLIRSER